MKIQKFGVIKFTEGGLPCPEGFEVIPESEEEQNLIKANKEYFLVLLLAAISKHMSIAQMRVACEVDRRAESNPQTFSTPFLGFDKSPEQIVSESLLRASGKHE